ncbi:hypothetical protein BC781_1192 [Sediminitomix flava]|uniref:Uncharacterized protein n=2 Tax=Sediminitomix flava TaxID=379075 RepID=A0A315YUL7_SEDFL|nr:hypothetical protein BC781_1192 [Sediminitomix flava]
MKKKKYTKEIVSIIFSLLAIVLGILLEIKGVAYKYTSSIKILGAYNYSLEPSENSFHLGLILIVLGPLTLILSIYQLPYYHPIRKTWDQLIDSIFYRF